MIKYAKRALITVLLGLAFNGNAFPHQDSQIYNISNDQTLTHLMRQHGFSASEVHQTIQSPHWPKEFQLRKGQRYFFSEKSAELVLIAPKKHEVIHIRRHTNRNPSSVGSKVQSKIVVKISPVTYEVRPRLVEGHVNGSVYNSLRAELDDVTVIYSFIDIFRVQFPLQRLQKGAHFRFKVEELYLNGAFIRFGNILKAELQYQGKIHRKKLYALNGTQVYVCEEDLESERPFYAPVAQIELSSLYTRRRRHPVTGRVQAHLGIDYVGKTNEPLYAVAEGKILRMGTNRAAGKYIAIGHRNGYESIYNHLSHLAKGLRPGVFVFAGQFIGGMGCTGYCTKPHLHFAVKKRGRFVNPLYLVRPYPRHAEYQLVQAMGQKLADAN